MLVHTEIVFESDHIELHRKIKIKEGPWQSFIVILNSYSKRRKFTLGWNGSRFSVASDHDRLKKIAPEILAQVELFIIKHFTDSENKYKSIAEERDVTELIHFTQEINTVFRNNIADIKNNMSFNAIRELSVNFVKKLTVAESDKLYRELNGGAAIIEKEGHLHRYIYAYGKMHQAKLNECFKTIENLQTELNAKDIQIIDYGCGQGIGSIIFIDFIKSNHLTNFTISKIILIEPSEIALKRASLNVKYCLKSVAKNENILAINKTIEQIGSQDLSTKSTSTKFHIFSNILDVNDFNIDLFAQKIDNSQKGTNYFICVSPKLWKKGKHPRNLRLDTFMNYFQQRRNVKVLSQRETDICTNTDNWARYERIFKVIY